MHLFSTFMSLSCLLTYVLHMCTESDTLCIKFTNVANKVHVYHCNVLSWTLRINKKFCMCCTNIVLSEMHIVESDVVCIQKLYEWLKVQSI